MQSAEVPWTAVSEDVWLFSNYKFMGEEDSREYERVSHGCTVEGVNDVEA